jgi:hypothetical protein
MNATQISAKIAQVRAALDATGFEYWEAYAQVQDRHTWYVRAPFGSLFTALDNVGVMLGSSDVEDVTRVSFSI